MVVAPIQLTTLSDLQRKDGKISDNPIKKIRESIPSSMGRALDLVSSSAFANASFVSFKNLPYALGKQEFQLNTIENAISSRISYLEVTVMSASSFGVNLVASLFFSVFTVITLAKHQPLVRECQKYWIHTAFSVASIGVGIAGIASPKFGLIANSGAVTLLFYAIAKDTERDVINLIKKIYSSNKGMLEEAGRKMAADEGTYNRQYKPLLMVLDEKIPLLKSYSDLKDVFQSLRECLRIQTSSSF